MNQHEDNPFASPTAAQQTAALGGTRTERNNLIVVAFLIYFGLCSMHLLAGLGIGSLAHGLLAAISGTLGGLLIYPHPLTRFLGWITPVTILVMVSGLPVQFLVGYLLIAGLVLFDGYQRLIQPSHA